MKDAKKAKRILLKILSWTGWIFAFITTLLIALTLLVRLPAVQNRITQKVISYLEDKIGTKVQLEHIYISFPTEISLRGIYLADQSKDTLLYAQELNIKTDLWGLTQNQVNLARVELINCTASVHRPTADSAFNFTYIINAFASDTVAEDTTAVAWDITVDEVSISKTKLSYHDALDGNQATFKIGGLELDMDEFSPAESVYEVKSLHVENSNTEIIQSKLTREESVSDTIPAKSPSIDFNDIQFTDVKIHYNNAAGQEIRADLGELTVRANDVDLGNNSIAVEKLRLVGSEVSFRQDRKASNPGDLHQTDSASVGLDLPWDIRINEITLADNTLQYDDFNQAPKQASIDFNHLFLFGVQLSAEKLAVKGNTLKGNIANLSFQEKKGLVVQSLVADLELTENKLDLSKFILQTANSKLEIHGAASFPSLERYDHATINFQITQSTIAIQDVLFFSPTLLDSVPLDLPDSTTILVDARLDGPLNNLTINQLQVNALNKTKLALNGNIRGLPDFDQAVMDIEVKQFYTVASDINPVLADSVLPTSVALPEWVELHGKFTGTIRASNIQAELTSNVGQVNAQGKFKFSEIPVYDATVNTRQLHLGKILKQSETMGTLDMQAAVKGSGFTMDSLNAVFDILVDQFQYHQYEYRDFKLEGKLVNYLFSGVGSLHDDNLDFDFEGDLDYQKEIPLYNFTLDLRNADFEKLNLSERPLKVRGTLDINLSTADFQVINGTLAIRKVGIYNGEGLYLVDSLMFASLDQEGESSMTIQSDIVSGEFKGTFNLFRLPGVMRQHINQYFSLQDKTLTAFTAPQNFKFDLTLKNTDLITEILVPELDSFVPGNISGEFNSLENKLSIEIGIAQIKYATTAADSVALSVISNESSLSFMFRLKNLQRDTLTIDAMQLTGKIQHDSIYSAFQILNAKDEKKYMLGGVIKSQDDKFRFKFLQDQVILNYTSWTVPDDNYLDFNSRGIQTHNFAITGGPERIGLVTTVKDSTISVEFQDLQLSSLTRIVRGVMPARGKLNGNLKFTSAAKGTFSSKLLVSDLAVLEQPYGDLTVTLSHAGNRYGIDLQVKNEGSNLLANGFYITDEKTSSFNLSLKLSPFNLSLIEPLSYGELKNVKGVAEGALQVSGSSEKPVVRGEIIFREASFTPTYLNNTFFLNNEKISFTETGIAFNDFTLHDSKKNEAIIQGDIVTEAFRNLRFNLRVSAKNFQLLNTTAEDNKLFYGKVKVNTVIRITGTSNRPRVDMTASLSKDSELTYVVPQEQKSVMEQEGIVQFVDKDAVFDPFLADINLEDTVASAFAGINISANIELTDQETLHIIIDPITGDKLSVKGNSSLTFNMTTSGNMNLSGRYEISEGSYNISFYKLVKRKFEILRGGTITWSGNPFNALLDIRAQYKVETTPIDLISNQVSSTDPEQLNSYKQRLPFLVLMDIKGQLLAPQITFQIDMPVEKRAAFGGVIYAKLVDINTRESDVNKQVFALLILKRFVSDNPLESSAGSDVANATRTSVSRILSEQLNRLSENIKGVQLSVDIKSYQDYSSGQSQGDTQVQLGVSKSLFNDRLVVKLSGNVDVEGENTTQEEVSDYIGDLAIEYKLTSDGRFRVTGFRTNNYDLIDGELVETGAGLIYIKDYNTLRELFKRNVREK